MRNRPIAAVGSKEEIVEYTHSLSGIVRCLVGHGEDDGNGNFIPTASQNYEVHELTSEEYSDLMAANAQTGKPANVFRKDDLWAFVDNKRGA